MIDDADYDATLNPFGDDDEEEDAFEDAPTTSDTAPLTPAPSPREAPPKPPRSPRPPPPRPPRPPNQYAGVAACSLFVPMVSMEMFSVLF